MQTIKITVFRTRKSFETAEIEVAVQAGDTIEDVLGNAELNANDLRAWSTADFGSFPTCDQADKAKIEAALAAAQETA